MSPPGDVKKDWWPPTDLKDSYPVGEFPDQFVQQAGNVPGQQLIFPNVAAEIAAKEQTGYSTQSQQFQLELEKITASAGIQVANAQKEIAEIRRKWEDLNQDFNRRHDQIVTHTQMFRADEATKPNGKLNYQERIKLITTRYEKDLNDALIRMKAASTGLRQIFGFDNLLPGQKSPSDSFPAPGQTSSRQFHEDCVVWARDAANYLGQFSQFDQGCVHVLSLKSTLTDADWKTGLDQRYWRVNFPETWNWGEKMYHLRIKGLSAFVIHGDPAAVWRLRAKLPTLGRFILPNGRGELPQQGELPSVRFGRVQSRSSPIPPDIVGTASAANASPFGEWQVWLDPAINASANLSEVSDVQLDLHLAYQSA